jgi:hypothetical protein
MTDEPRPDGMTDEERAFHELGMDGVIADAPDSDDTGDETSDDADDAADGPPGEGTS